MRRFTSKNHVYENFDVMGIQRRFAASFPKKVLLRNRPAFHSKEKCRGYSVYSYSRIGSIERPLSVDQAKNKKQQLENKKKNATISSTKLPTLFSLYGHVILCHKFVQCKIENCQGGL